jgi:hypothetical protein
MAKLKGWTDVRMSLQHNTRERMPPNADPKWSGDNYNYGGDTEDTMSRMDEIMPDKIRENAVYAVEVLMTASPDFSGNWKQYLKACDEWAQGIFGKSNLMHINHHFDESTPHTHIVFTPVKDGKLNAKHFIGGHRDRMVELQNDFYEKVGKQFELERGQSRSETRSRHTAHTLAGKAAELDDREAVITEREKFLDKVVKEQERKTNRAAAAAEEREKATGEKLAELKKIGQIQLLKNMIEEGVMRRTGLKTAEFKKRVLDYVVKTLPEHIRSCYLAVMRNEDPVRGPDRQKQQGHNISR